MKVLFLLLSSLLLCIWLIKIVIFYSIQNVRSSHRRLFFGKDNRAALNSIITNSKKLILVLPVLQEQKLIAETLEYMLSILQRFSFVELVIVGTARERWEDGKNDTLGIVENRISQHPVLSITCLESTAMNGNMATQDNYAAEFLKSNGYDLENTRCHFINIDSRFDDLYFDEIIYHLDKGTSIMLQSSLFTKNFEQIPGICQWSALAQTRWTITSEQYRVMMNYYFFSEQLYHVVGHGLIIRLSKFLYYKWFPDDTQNEDLHFWYYLSVHGEKCFPLSSYEIADVPSSFTSRRSQAKVWFIWILQYTLYREKLQKKFWISSFRSFHMMTQWLIHACKWLFVSYILWLTCILWVLQWDIYALIWMVFCVSVYLTQYLLTIMYLKKEGYIESSVIRSMIYVVWFVSVWSLPVTVSLMEYMATKLWLYQIYKYKTPHG